MFDEPIGFKEADEALAKRLDTPTRLKYREIISAWDDEARSKAFFSARVSSASILSEIHQQVADVVSGKGTKQQAYEWINRYFIGEGADALAAIGFAPPKEANGVAELGSVARIKLIIDTQVKMAQEVGQYQQWEASKQQFPYGIWKIGYAEEHREEHVARDGKVYAFDHPIWTGSPPGGEFNCHCYRLLLGEEDLAERGLTPEPMDSPFEPSSLGFNPASGMPDKPPFGKRVMPEYRNIAERMMDKIVDTIGRAKRWVTNRLKWK